MQNPGLYGTVARIGEVISLTLADVDLSDRLLTIRNTKFHKSRLVPIGLKLTTALEVYEKNAVTYHARQVEIQPFSSAAQEMRLYIIRHCGYSAGCATMPGFIVMTAAISPAYMISGTHQQYTGLLHGIAKGTMSGTCYSY